MHNDLPKLELSGAWEPLYSHSPLSFSERKSSTCFVPYGDETNRRGDEKIQEDLRYNAMLAIPCVRRVGGLAMLWKSEVSLDIQTYSLNHIDAHILNDPSTPWRLTSFYGRPKDHRKHESWNYLRHLHSRASLSWVCVRDYNEILTSNEKQGGILKAGRLMEDFRCALLHCGLIDLGFSGNKFT